MNIVLLGYMASGKSAVGKQLASHLKMDFVDLDDYIEAHEDKAISDIFQSNGEIYFRIKETEYLSKLLSESDNLVLSLGGGTPCYGNNMGVILDHSNSVYLRTSIDTIYNRLQDETLKRPLVASIKDEKLKEFIAKHLFERRAFYEKANFTVSTDKYSIDEIVTQILENQSK